jgi:hypothetical protein
MLDAGIRSLRINTCNLTRANTLGEFAGLYLCHGQWIEMFAAKLALGLNLTVVFRTFDSYLTDVGRWLEAHPSEVVFIFDEGNAGAALVGPVYEARVAPFTAPFQVRDPKAVWPTYQTLLDTNQRLIVFMDDGSVPNPTYPYLNRMWYCFVLDPAVPRNVPSGLVCICPLLSIRYSEQDGVGSVMQAPWDYWVESDIRFLPNQTSHGSGGAGDVSASLYLFNHCFYTNALPIYGKVFGELIEIIIQIFAGSSFDFSDPTKNAWTVGAPYLAQDVWTAWSPKGASRRPNFVAVVCSCVAGRRKSSVVLC